MPKKRMTMPKRVWVTWTACDWRKNGVDEAGICWDRREVFKLPSENGEQTREYVLVEKKGKR